MSNQDTVPGTVEMRKGMSLAVSADPKQEGLHPFPHSCLDLKHPAGVSASAEDMYT